MVIVDLSAPNPNVYYELGLCDAIGKDYRLLKQAGVTLPADLSGAHYIEYSLDEHGLGAGKTALAKELSTWVKENDLTSIRTEKANAI